jgi:hypothetical protein
MHAPEHAKIYETQLFDCWLVEPGIVYLLSKKGERSIENYRDAFKVYEEISQSGTHKFCVLGNITDTQPFSKEVREFVEQETSKHLKAMALISESVVGRAVANIFEYLHETPYPVALFGTEKDAIAWLRKF